MYCIFFRQVYLICIIIDSFEDMERTIFSGTKFGFTLSRESILSKLKPNPISDENQIKEAFINGGRGHPPSHLKFFLLVFSKLKEDIK